ncbi:MAG: hypothetical protein E6099_02165 [Enterobacter sp.]|nr:hypothetical protein [Enterobacter sp.]
MFEFLIGVVTHTPVWVWVLFIFLISRGLKARRPATVTLERLAIIPGIFLIWDIYDLIVYRTLTPGTVALWTAGILAGAALGYVLIKQAVITRAEAPRSLYRQADYTALPFMMLAFGVKYVLGVMSAVSPQTMQQPAERAGDRLRRRVCRRLYREICALCWSLCRPGSGLMPSPQPSPAGRGRKPCRPGKAQPPPGD